MKTTAVKTVHAHAAAAHAAAVHAAAVVLLLGAAACGGRAVGGRPTDGAPPGGDAALPDASADGSVDTPRPWLAFLRHQSGSEPAGLYAVRDDGGALDHLSGGIDPAGAVEVFALSRLGGVYREALTDASGRRLRYHVVRRDGSPLSVTPFEPWDLRVPDLGLMRQGALAWALPTSGLEVVDLAAETLDDYATRGVLLATEGGRWVLTREQTAAEITVSALDLETGSTRPLHTFSSQQMPYGLVYDPEAEVAYAGVGTDDLWALPLSGVGARSLSAQWGVAGRLVGRVKGTGALVVLRNAQPAELLALDPASGSLRLRQALDGEEESHTLSEDGALFASVRFGADGAARLDVIDTGSGALTQVSLAGHRDLPWSCCCGGPRAGPPALAPARGLAAIPVRYDFGMCACACMEAPPPPEQTPLEILVVDLAGGQVLWSVPHNGQCAPRFSPAGDRLALCDNDLHIVPMAGGYLKSAVALHDLESRQTLWLTDQDGNATDVDWIR